MATATATVEPGDFVATIDNETGEVVLRSMVIRITAAGKFSVTNEWPYINRLFSTELVNGVYPGTGGPYHRKFSMRPLTEEEWDDVQKRMNWGEYRK